MHLTITPAQYKKLNEMGRKGGGSIPQAFDPDDWDEIKSVVEPRTSNPEPQTWNLKPGTSNFTHPRPPSRLRAPGR